MASIIQINKVKEVSQNFADEMKHNTNFQMLLSCIIPMIELIETDDYCLFIILKQTVNGTEITVDDGGSGWDDEQEVEVYKTYLNVQTSIKINKEYTLYFSIDEGILCFLDER